MITENADTTVVIDESVSTDQLREMLKTGEAPEVVTAPKVEEKKSTETKPSSAAASADGEKPAAGSDPANSQEPTNEDEEKLPGWVKKRIWQLSSKNRALKEENAKLATPPADKGVASPAAVAEAPKEPVMPELETFQGTYGEYQKALSKYVGDLTDYKLALAEQSREQKAQQKTVEQRQRDQAKVWNEAEAAVMKKADRADYAEVADSVQLPPTSPASSAIAQAIQDSEIGPELLYHLGKNPAVVEKLTGMSPIGAVRELGKIEAALTAEPAKPEKPVEKKPLPKPPAIPAGGAHVPEIDLNDENLDQATFNREAKRRLNAA